MISRKNNSKEIWSTLGPASLNEKVIKRLDEVGVSVFRINLSHTAPEEIEKNVEKIKEYTKVPICLDTEGPQVRTGDVEGGQIFLKENTLVTITKEHIMGDRNSFTLRPSCIFSQLMIGDLISIDFDSALLSVVEKKGSQLIARVICSGSVGSNKAVTVDRDIDMDILTEKDIYGLEVLKKQNLKIISLSFVNSSGDVERVRAMVDEDVRIISKIETKNAVKNLDAILQVSDGILIDRGDLSRQEPINKIPLLQKEIIKRANKVKKPVFVATNILESMVKTKRPLRSEVNDIMTTLLDGANGLVLAAETAIGKYPVECGNMVRRMMKYFDIAKGGTTLDALLKNDSFLLIEPHGGELIESYAKDQNLAELEKLPKLIVDDLMILDAEQIGIGAYSPLRGFMNENELNSVLNDYKMPSGVIWTLPIIMQVSQLDKKRLSGKMEVALVYSQDNKIYATMHINDIYKINLEKVAKKWFGTADTEHPGVYRLFQKGEYCVGGEICLVRRKESIYKQYEYTPRQTRSIFEHKEWSKVAGFHTRNVIHRAHEYLQISTIEKYNLDGMLLHPVVGPKKALDFQPEIIMESYKLMFDIVYSYEQFVFGAFSGYSHYAGPREAVFTALCRKNFGCSHFILGRDHTGVKDFYKKGEVVDLFNKIGDIGIKPIFFDTVYFCEKCGNYVEFCDHTEEYHFHISGTQGRKILLSGKQPPEWFLRKEISSMILAKIKKGEEVFV